MEKEKKGFFARIKEGLTKTREQLTQRVEELVHDYKEIDDDFFDELTDILVASDLGVNGAVDLVERVRAKVKAQKIGRPEAIHQLIREAIVEQLGENAPLEPVSYTHLERLQKDGPVDIRYELVDQEGPPHDSTFIMAVLLLIHLLQRFGCRRLLSGLLAFTLSLIHISLADRVFI